MAALQNPMTWGYPGEGHAYTVQREEGAQEMKDLITKYNHLFEGIGKIEDKFHMRPEAVPIAQKPRQVPYYLQEPLTKWLDLGIKEDIFEKVPDDEPVTRCFPLWVHSKPKFAGIS